MRNLWRALALAWLGGVASPGLADDTLLPDTLIVADAPDDEGGDEGQDEAGSISREPG